MTGRPMNRLVAAGLALVAGVALTGCEYKGGDSLPLPGAIGGKDTYRVTMVFSDATNLVPKETCRTNDTVVGSVESVELDENLKARVTCRIKDSVSLPANVIASLRETSLLGERYVGLDPAPGTEPQGTLKPGAEVPEASTRADPNAEMVLGALSQLLNGGSLGSIQTISRELNAALSSSDFKATARQLRLVVGTLNDRRSDITATLDAMDKLAGRLAKQKKVLGQALDAVPGGLAVLDRQRPKLTRTLLTLGRLSRVAVPLIERSKANTVADLKHVAPVLTELFKQGDELAKALERIASFPFPSTFLDTVKGDYGGMYASIALDIDSLNALLAGGSQPPVPGRTADEPSLPGLQLPGLPALPGLPGLPLGVDGVLDLGDLLLGGAR